jgi:hypothetical protein
MLPLSARAAVASPVHVTVKATSAARMADDNRMSKSPLGLTLVSFDEVTTPSDKDATNRTGKQV